MESKLVSILIPVYNRENLIEETVRSAMKQTYKNIEIVVVDNCSTDNTWEVLQNLAKEDSRIKIFRNNENIGPVRNWKRCIDEAKGIYGKILWSDDLISPEFIEKTLPFLDKNPEVGFVFTGTEIFDTENGVKNLAYFIGDTGIYSTDQYIKGVIFESNYPVSPGCALFRLNDLKDNLLINIPNKIGSDFSMHAVGNDLLIFLLTAHKYKKFAFINETLSFFRAHKNSISVSTDIGRLSLLYTLAKAYFVENYRKDLVKKLNADIWIRINVYSEIAKELKLDKIENFYMSNTDYKIDLFCLIKKITKKIIERPLK